MKAVILAAGKPLTGAEPVSSLAIRDERLLDVQVSVLRSAGVEAVRLVAGFRAERISRPDIDIVRNDAWQDGGSIGSLGCVAEMLDGSDDILVCYGDTLFSPRVLDRLFRAEGGVAALCFLDRTNRDIGRFREFAHLDAGELIGVSSSRSTDDVRAVFCGLVLVRRGKAQAVRGFLATAMRERSAHLGSLIDLMVRSGVEVAPVLVERGWLELATPALIEEALREDEFLDTVIQIHTDWAARAQRYDQLQWVNNDRLLAAMVAAAATQRPQRVLDVGTGSGKVLLALRDALGRGEFWGVDLSREMMEHIPRKEGLTLRIANAETLEEIPDGHFDLVTARMVFHHVDDLLRAMRSIARVLRPGGCLVACEGVPPSTRTVRWYTEMFRYKEDRRTLTEGDLIHAFARAGFCEIHTDTVVMEKASLNNWLDNSGIPQRNIDVIKEMHFKAPAEVASDYDMEFVNGDCLMTWRFAVVTGRRPAQR
jgi:ubiquinone/menaquinone biosynthesis C-methylase UbiE/choline kinase